MGENLLGIDGDAEDAVLAADRTNEPKAQAIADLIDFIEGKSQITVEAREGMSVQGYAPGDDLNEVPRILCLAEGCIARLIVEPDDRWNQTPHILADMVARGRMDIVDDALFADAGDHKEIHRDLRKRELARQAKRADGVGGVGAIAAMMAAAGAAGRLPDEGGAGLAELAVAVDAMTEKMVSLESELSTVKSENSSLKSEVAALKSAGEKPADGNKPKGGGKKS